MLSSTRVNWTRSINGRVTSKLWVPFIPDADVGTNDFSAQRCRRFCHMQGLIAVESHGQVCMSGPLGDFAGVSVDATGQVYSQNKSAAFVQTVHQPAGGKAGGPQCAMESGAVQGDCSFSRRRTQNHRCHHQF